MKNLLITLVLALSLALAACDFDGGVEQGRCVAYDADKHTVTLVVDTTLDQHDPHYSGKVDTFTLPDNPLDMGPAPEAGGRLMVEPDKNKVLIYDPATKSIKEIDAEFIGKEENVGAKSPKLKGKEFPIIDKAAGTVTIYSPRRETIYTLKVSPEILELPAYIWKPGDEVRIAFRKDKPGLAIRFMNVSKTSIYTR